MGLHPLAGKPAPPSMLVNVPRLISHYYANRPDPDDDEATNADGPPINTLTVVDDLNLDFSGARLEVGLRLYFF